MSLQLVIPWRVALQQSPPPLHQPVATLQQWRGGSQLSIRCYLFTTLARGLTLGAHPTFSPTTQLKQGVNESYLQILDALLDNMAIVNSNVNGYNAGVRLAVGI